MTISAVGSGSVDVEGKNDKSPGVKPVAGSSSAEGGLNLNGCPSAPISVSDKGLKESFPLKDMAVTRSGEARKFIVFILPSLRPLKFRLKDVRMAVYTLS